MIPRRYAHPRRWLLAFLFAFNFFVPIAGLVCVIGGLAFSLALPRRTAAETYGKVQAPRFTTHRNAEGTGFRGGQVRALREGRALGEARLEGAGRIDHGKAGGRQRHASKHTRFLRKEHRDANE